MTKITWPKNKKFAFTIVDDTDFATIKNIKPVYDLLNDLKIHTTKTVWSYPPRDNFTGDSLQDAQYLKFIQSLANNGFEIAFHGAGSGQFNREEIIQALEIFNEKLNFLPNIHINHAHNYDNLYWGHDRFQLPIRTLIKLRYGDTRKFYGTDKSSESFWGDIAKKQFKYIRNHTFNSINTLKYDPKMPYRDKSKDKYSNFWFSGSDGHTVEEFNGTVNPKNIDKLIQEGGACIMYTHFANGFVDSNGKLNPQFEASMRYLAEQNGWFVPASELLDFLQSQQKTEHASPLYLNLLDIRWVIDRIIKKVKYKR